jgi:hypothetical protein
MFAEDTDKLFDSFNSVKHAAPSQTLLSPLSDHSPPIGHWTKASMMIRAGSPLRMVNLPSGN